MLVVTPVLEEGVSPFSPLSIGNDLVGDKEDYNYGQIGKAVLHLWFVPFLLYFLNPQSSLAYILAVSFLYSTVFRSKSKEFWGVLAFSIAMIVLFILPS